MVWEALQLSTGRRRAVKMLRPELAEDPRILHRFEQEALIGARIPSEHIVQVIAAGIDSCSGYPWLAMELLEGQDLANYLVDREYLEPERLLEILRQACHGLAAAHDVGIVHRDIKPENVFLARSMHAETKFTVKLLDFGVAKLMAETSASGTSPIGTPLFMAPEQCCGKSVAPSTDVWALGLLAFRCLTGAHYWAAARAAEVSILELVTELREGPLEAASMRAERFRAAGRPPREFDDWFARCVVRDPAQRFPDARVAMMALEHALTRLRRGKRPRPPLPGQHSRLPPSLRRAAKRGFKLGLGFWAVTVGLGAAATVITTRCGG